MSSQGETFCLKNSSKLNVLHKTKLVGFDVATASALNLTNVFSSGSPSSIMPSKVRSSDPEQLKQHFRFKSHFLWCWGLDEAGIWQFPQDNDDALDEHLDVYDDAYEHHDWQEKISISAGGALAFDTVNLLINTFSSLVRWSMDITLCKKMNWFFNNVCPSGKKAVCSRRGKEKEAVSQSGSSFILSTVIIINLIIKLSSTWSLSYNCFIKGAEIWAKWTNQPPGNLARESYRWFLIW